MPHLFLDVSHILYPFPLSSTSICPLFFSEFSLLTNDWASALTVLFKDLFPSQWYHHHLFWRQAGVVPEAFLLALSWLANPSPALKEQLPWIPPDVLQIPSMCWASSQPSMRGKTSHLYVVVARKEEIAKKDLYGAIWSRVWHEPFINAGHHQQLSPSLWAYSQESIWVFLNSVFLNL